MDRINSITQECFGALLQLRQFGDHALPSAELVHRQLRTFFDRLLKRAGELGFNQQDAQEIAYPIVALADELALGRADTFREYWLANLLQFHYFRENRAGDGFFTRLEEVRKDAQRTEILRVYYLCLIFGFKGRFRVRGGELELMQLTETLQRELARTHRFDTEMLSPHGDRPPDSAVSAKRTLPLLAISAAAVVFALLVYTGLRIGLSSSVSSLFEEVAASSPQQP
ncbi:DotU family type IV/VI secretion system protein [Myxococcus sp. K15C18031901]|uniref:DotU family type IV/VI secretion system protein n=1 Tax=Myxococcus dinghuensis TaxID=2906761 RepID=UPI0020A7BA72|nr:DotU family type IV/VI secretion system protein [Myxococcus dinghuensis]MCP3098212.1 DotU family type IV/VI secretion system protein [Myxococcus dinghuensis]